MAPRLPASALGLVAALLAALSSPARAATWEIDAAHSNVGFVVNRLNGF